jgi:prephenate dehydrogenase
MAAAESLAPFRRIAVLGTGLIGGSFALGLRKFAPGTHIVGFDRPDTVARAVSRNAVHEATATLADAVRGADLIYIALPIRAAIDALSTIAAQASPTSLVTDACSTKSVVCREARRHFGPATGSRFLGGHPMAGNEASGIDHAAPDLFSGARYALIGRDADNEGDPRIDRFVALLRAIGTHPVWTDADTHDWAAGIVSHLPQLASLALARVVHDETDETGLPLSLAGGGLRDTLRLAGSRYHVWRDICLTNTANVSRALDRLAQAIDHLRTHLADRELESEFQAANELYKSLKQMK